MDVHEAFDAIRRKPSSPAKQFELVKVFGGMLKKFGGVADPKCLSCVELEAKILKILDRDDETRSSSK
jgi:hypothetical protein